MFRGTIRRRLRRIPRELNTGRLTGAHRYAPAADTLALFSHELRTPLHGLSGMLELLQASRLSDTQQQLVDAIQHCSQSLASMLDGGMEIPGQKFKPTFSTISKFDPLTKLEHTIAMFLGWAGTQSMQLGYSISRDTPSLVLADGGRLQQVLNNLLSNAIRHAGGGTVMVRLSFTRTDPFMLKIEVTDNGAGIPGHQNDRHIEVCHEVRHPGPGVYSGNGLGLQISRALVQSGGGTMHISSNTGGGTCCNFTLPATPVSRRTGMTPVRSKLLRRKCVLVIAAAEWQESICCHLQRWDISYLSRQSLDCLADSTLEGTDIDTLILDLPTAESKPHEDMGTIREACPGAHVAVLLPFAGKRDCHVELEGVRWLSKPLTRDGLAAWLMACSLHEKANGYG